MREVRRTVVNVAAKMEVLQMIFLGTLAVCLVSRIIYKAASTKESVRLHFGCTTFPEGSGQENVESNTDRSFMIWTFHFTVMTN
jgi:hypothetical protein